MICLFFKGYTLVTLKGPSQEPNKQVKLFPCHYNSRGSGVGTSSDTSQVNLTEHVCLIGHASFPQHSYYVKSNKEKNCMDVQQHIISLDRSNEIRLCVGCHVVFTSQISENVLKSC